MTICAYFLLLWISPSAKRGKTLNDTEKDDIVDPRLLTAIGPRSADFILY